MLLDKLQRNPEKIVPIGMALLTVGLAITLEVISIVVLAHAARRKRQQ